MRIHHVQLAAPRSEEPRMRAFWVDVLGFEELPKPPGLAQRGGCWFRLGEIELHVGIEEPFVPQAKAHPGFLVDDLDRWAARMTDAGYPVAFDPDFPGMRRFYSHDPFGNRLEFLEPARGKGLVG
jgi:catechol 2,3-dioxygenase-like lactoylglutathione lyase family enzyme